MRNTQRGTSAEPIQEPIADARNSCFSHRLECDDFNEFNRVRNALCLRRGPTATGGGSAKLLLLLVKLTRSDECRGRKDLNLGVSTTEIFPLGRILLHQIGKVSFIP